MNEILSYLPLLGMLVVSNLLLGTYYSIGVQEMPFEWAKLFNGIKKAFVIAVAFIVLAYTFERVDIGGDILTPQLIMTTALATYAGKVVMNLTHILGIAKDEERSE